MSESFYDWCIRNNHCELLEMWENGGNDLNPKDVTTKSTRKVSLWCGNPKHKPKILCVSSLTDPGRTGLTIERMCVGCHSVGKRISDIYGEEYLNQIWSPKNDLTPYEIAVNSKSKRIWLRCLHDESHPDYQLVAGNVVNAFGCPYCRNRKLFNGNNLALIRPDVYLHWSDKNTKGPDEYVIGSHEKVWFKCSVPTHEDYHREVRNGIKYNFKCPICLRIDAAKKGPEHPRFLGNTTEYHRQRNCSNYRSWRSMVFRRDNYTCQCCGKKDVYLNAHHIYSFASHPSTRFDPTNGITLCEECHSIREANSLHGLYGIRDVTPDQLVTYINNKREALGITQPFRLDDYIT